jgi:hypothetical protein
MSWFLVIIIGICSNFYTFNIKCLNWVLYLFTNNWYLFILTYTFYLIKMMIIIIIIAIFITCILIILIVIIMYIEFFFIFLILISINNWFIFSRFIRYIIPWIILLILWDIIHKIIFFLINIDRTIFCYLLWILLLIFISFYCTIKIILIFIYIL